MLLTSVQIEDLFHRYRDELTRRLAAMVKSHETAADLMQEAYLRLLGLVNTRAVEHPRALLHRIATNLAIDHLRRDRHCPQIADSLDGMIEVSCGTPSPERAAMGKERLGIFLKGIDALPPRTREAFLLYRVYGYSYREISIRMNISESGVEKLLMRALHQASAILDALNADE
ncbi:MAG: RNA polymerase sigma factor [Nitrospira sp.]|nr:RNA polymerase sigma factor [Nitrospira sp.]